MGIKGVVEGFSPSVFGTLKIVGKVWGVVFGRCKIVGNY